MKPSSISVRFLPFMFLRRFGRFDMFTANLCLCAPHHIEIVLPNAALVSAHIVLSVLPMLGVDLEVVWRSTLSLNSPCI